MGNKPYAGSVVDPDPLAITDIKWTRHDLTLLVEHSFGAKFRLGGFVPFMNLHVENRAMMTEGGTGKFKMGDAGLYGVFTPWERSAPHPPHRFFDLQNLSLYAGLTFPTGDERNAALPALHFAQTGSGSIDPRFGVGYAAPIGSYFGAFLDAGLRLDGGADGAGFRNGPLWTARLGGSFTPHKIVSVGVAAELVIRERNLQTGRALSESGGIHTFVVPRVLVRPFKGLFFDATLGIPIWRHVNFQQPVMAYYFSVAAGYFF